MKKIALLLFVILMLSAFCFSGCGSQSVKLVYKYGGIDVEETLSEQESKEIIDILEKKEPSEGIPMCGFDEKISLSVDEMIYAPACDSCAIVMDCGSGQYYDISEEGKDVIESIFEKYAEKLPYVE